MTAGEKGRAEEKLAHRADRSLCPVDQGQENWFSTTRGTLMLMKKSETSTALQVAQNFKKFGWPLAGAAGSS